MPYFIKLASIKPARAQAMEIVKEKQAAFPSWKDCKDMPLETYCKNMWTVHQNIQVELFEEAQVNIFKVIVIKKKTRGLAIFPQ